jgi:hypothetical protein
MRQTGRFLKFHRTFRLGTFRRSLNSRSLHSAVAGAPAPVGMTGCLLLRVLDGAARPPLLRRRQ